MSWRFFKNLTIPLASGISLYYISHDKLKTVYNSWTTDYKPSGKGNDDKIRIFLLISLKIKLAEWDANWDHRAPTSIIKPLSQNPTPSQENEYNEKLEKHKPKAVRHLILIRHGKQKSSS